MEKQSRNTENKIQTEQGEKKEGKSVSDREYIRRVNVEYTLHEVENLKAKTNTPLISGFIFCIPFLFLFVLCTRIRIKEIVWFSCLVGIIAEWVLIYRTTGRTKTLLNIDLGCLYRNSFESDFHLRIFVKPITVTMFYFGMGLVFPLHHISYWLIGLVIFICTFVWAVYSVVAVKKGNIPDKAKVDNMGYIYALASLENYMSITTFVFSVLMLGTAFFGQGYDRLFEPLNDDFVYREMVEIPETVFSQTPEDIIKYSEDGKSKVLYESDGGISYAVNEEPFGFIFRGSTFEVSDISTYFSKYKTVENYGKYYSFVTIEGIDVGTKKLSKLFNPVRDTIRYAGDIELELSLISSDYEQMILMKPRFYVDYMGKIIYCFESTNVVPKKTTINEVYTVYVNQGKIVTDENGERQEVKDRYGSDGSLSEVLSIDNLDSTIREDFGL